MTLPLLFKLLLCLVLAAGSAPVRALESESLGVCFDEADHTPYLYRDEARRWRGAR